MSDYDWNTPPLTPVLPKKDLLGPLKDMAQEVAMSSAGLEESVPRETAREIGEHLRLVNSYYSNLIEGHKTTIPEIQQALNRSFAHEPERRYAQELCAAHVLIEHELRDELETDDDPANICRPEYIREMHRRFYSHLPEGHRFTHDAGGFTRFPVLAGELRDREVTLDAHHPHGPRADDLPRSMEAFSHLFDPARSHGDERLISAAVSHHRLTWLHPFRDGNGRIARLHTGLYLFRIRINQCGLWSLSRGFSRNKQGYMLNLSATDSPGEENGNFFHAGLTADFCRFFFEICLDQIGFMRRLLQLEEVESRIEWLVADLIRGRMPGLAPESARVLRAVFRRGLVARGEIPQIVNMPERTARRKVIAPLLDAGLLMSTSHRAPLTVGLPLFSLPYLFPGLYDPTLIGDEYKGMIV
ncbi:MAG: Fic family protein [Desulfovibrionales bacterium]